MKNIVRIFIFVLNLFICVTVYAGDKEYLDSYRNENVYLVEVVKGISESRDISMNIDGEIKYSMSENRYKIIQGNTCNSSVNSKYVKALEGVPELLYDEYIKSSVSSYWLSYCKGFEVYPYNLCDSVTVGEMVELYAKLNYMNTVEGIFYFYGIESDVYDMKILYTELLPDDMTDETDVLTVERYLELLEFLNIKTNKYSEYEGIGLCTTMLYYRSEWCSLWNYMFRNEIWNISLDLNKGNISSNSLVYFLDMYDELIEKAWLEYELKYCGYAHLVEEPTVYIIKNENSYSLFCTLNSVCSEYLEKLKEDTGYIDYLNIDYEYLDSLSISDGLEKVIEVNNIVEILFKEIFGNDLEDNLYNVEDNLDDVQTVYQYITSNFKYNSLLDLEEDLSYSSYIGLVDGSCICSGFSGIFQLLCNELGVKTRAVSGYIERLDERHSWQSFYLEGVWYYCDCTWDKNGSLNYFCVDSFDGRLEDVLSIY